MGLVNWLHDIFLESEEEKKARKRHKESCQKEYLKYLNALTSIKDFDAENSHCNICGRSDWIFSSCKIHVTPDNLLLIITVKCQCGNTLGDYRPINWSKQLEENNLTIE